MYKACITGIGSYVPEHVLTNADLERMVETSDEWIVTRTGISERRIAAPWQATSDLAYHAAEAAIAHAGLTADQIDMIIVATSTPDHPFPPVACQLQHRLGCRHIPAYDLGATCVGFLSALETAAQFIATGKHKHILVVGADTLSRVTDYTDRTTCILFSDGAGAFLLSRQEEGRDQGILHTATHADGAHFPHLYVPGGGSRHPQPVAPDTKAKIVMDGRKIFKLAVTSMAQTVRETIQAAGIDASDIDWLIPHQANQRIIDAVAEQLAFPPEKVISTVKHYGNNSAATIPLAVDQAVRDGRIRRGDTLLLVAFGGGLVWGSILLTY
ncbi:ketoacyl-ACP synthase III [Brevibacillus sp. SYP-B805]|uniref:beta-ketoacyl-ACP synthase III n=1 Tax=Brevibacillus sp. SYP-B805 TaxID=1578199 RepID=UPI0013EC110A|nr:beta-ketoacyl-ACP synthase III [Brevibacillus sp. SYP-B805]NGQ95381.1 ketoacyl-ACP synthase III [Brevibacillus sp. SYP-B805]